MINIYILNTQTNSSFHCIRQWKTLRKWEGNHAQLQSCPWIETREYHIGAWLPQIWNI